MKLTVILLTAAFLQVHATGLSQKVTLSGNNMNLEQIFSAVEKQTGFTFFYDMPTVRGLKPVTIIAADLPLETFLKEIFSNQPLDYTIKNKTIAVSARTTSDAPAGWLAINMQRLSVTGIVRDADGQPLVGATVAVKNKNNLVVTNALGAFTINAVEGEVLIISFIGYETRSINVGTVTDLGDIRLTASLNKLDEVQIIAYGQTSKRLNTGNVSSVKADDIAKQPVTNPLLALQGRVPGLFIAQVSGVPGAGVNVTIQGTNSLQSGNDPFYVIDGVPYSSHFMATLAGNALSGQQSPLNLINPSDIESISVLKDADATAIYGSRAANGAILITTKRGKTGKVKVDINLQNGWGRISNKLKLLNTQQYLEMRKEAYKNDGLALPTASTLPNNSNFDLAIWDQNRYTDWQKELVGGTAQYADAQLSVSGGSATTQFLVGYGYNRQTSVYPNSLADIKGNIHFRLDHTSLNKKFKYLISANYLQNKNKLNSFDLMDAASSLPPNAPVLYNPDGSLNWEPYPNNPARYSFQNPLSTTKEIFNGNNSNLTANNVISYELLPGLQIKTSIGYTKLVGDESIILPITAFKPDRIRSRSAGFLNKSLQTLIMEPQVAYAKNTRLGSIDFLLGSTFQENKNDLLSVSGSGYTDDAQLLNLLAAPTVNIDQVVKTVYKYNAVFARLNYRLQNKYILNLTARRDGSSRFGDANRFHTFYAVGGAWLFGNEGALKQNLPWLSAGKIIASYGTTGNDQIADYTFQSLLETYSVDIPYQGGVGVFPTSIYNPYLQWEETKKMNIGINLGFLKDRVNLEINYFCNRSSNQLVPYILPSTAGFSGVTQNFPATVQNTGLEIMLNLLPVKTSDFTWSSSINFTRPRNKLIAFPDLANSTYANQYIIDQPINITRAYRFGGVDPATGLYQFIDHDGKLTSAPDPTGDRTLLIDINPDWYGGIANNFRYKGFELDFLIQAVRQLGINYSFGNFPGVGGSIIGNQPVHVLDRWRNPGDISNIQMFSSNGALTLGPAFTASGSDAGFSGSSYARLKNASLSYTLPGYWMKSMHISSLRLYAQGQNLITITRFTGTDPETKARYSLPPLKIVTVGLQVVF